MRFLAPFVFYVLVTSSLLIETALSEKAPDVMVREVVAQIKATGNPAVIVDHVDWPEAFKSMPDPDKYQLKISTPDEMKNFFREMLTSPSAAMRKSMTERLASLPAEKQEEAKLAIEKMSERLLAREAELKQRIKDTEYTVSDPKVTGDKATVVLAQTYKGEKSEEKIELRKKNGEWMLPSMKMGGATAAPKPAAGSDRKAAAAPAAAPGADSSTSAAPVSPPSAAPQ